MASPRYGGLVRDQEDAVLTLLRALADSELEAEEVRRRLCECPEFNPRAVFQALQGRARAKGWLSAYDLYLWLAEQPHAVAGYSSEDVAALVTLRTGTRELWFDDFARMTLPNLASGSWLKELALSRCPDGYERDVSLSPGLAFLVSQLMRLELDFTCRLRYHRQRLREVAMSMESAVKFMDAQQGVCAGMGGLISTIAVRQTLASGLGAGRFLSLSQQQCDAVLNRINPSGASLFATDILARIMGMAASPKFSSSRCESPSRSFENSVLESPRRAFESPAPTRIFDSPRAGLSTSYVNMASPVSPRLSPRSFLDRTPLPLSREAFSRSARGTWATSPLSPTTPLPDFLRPDARPPRHDGQKFSSVPIATVGWTSPRGRLSPRSSSLSLSPRREAAWKEKDSIRLSTASTYAPPASPLTSAPALTVHSSPAAYLGSSRRSWSLPREEQSPRSPRSLTLPSPAPLLSTPPSSGTREWRALRQTLRVMVRQAQFDARVEEAKSMLPLNCSVEDVFSELDVLRSGHVSLNDMRRLMGSYGSTLTYASFGSLVREMQLRRKAYEKNPLPMSAVPSPEHMTLRDLASLVLPSRSEALAYALEAKTDSEAKSVLYLLKNSEPCPGCGTRAQRNADAAGCPSVTCPACGTHFQCYTVASDKIDSVCLPLSSASRYQVYKLLVVALEAAEELENDRRDLSLMLAQELCGLCDVFANLAGTRDRLGFSQNDLRRAFAIQGLPQPEGQERELLWHRYAPLSASVNFMAFKSQLQPRL